jgi:hypothetical protein
MASIRFSNTLDLSHSLWCQFVKNRAGEGTSSCPSHVRLKCLDNIFLVDSYRLQEYEFSVFNGLDYGHILLGIS